MRDQVLRFRRPGLRLFSGALGGGVITTVATLCYVAVFVALYPVVGQAVVSLATVPVLVAGWRAGMLAGTLTGLLYIPLHMLLLRMVGSAGLDLWPHRLLLYSTLVLVGMSVGRLSDLQRRLRCQVDEERRRRQRLLQVKETLEKAISRHRRELAEAREALHKQLRLKEWEGARLREDNDRLRAALEALEESQRQIIQQERLHALGRMASGVAHDINNTLTPILGFSELLLLRPEYLADREKALGYLRIIHTAAKDAANVVRRLREFYRHRDTSPAFRPVDVNRVVRDAVSLTSPRWKDEAQGSDATIRLITSLKRVPPVPGDEGELREALANLIFNAVDAMPHGGTITIATSYEAGRVVVRVTDTGVGMTPDVRERCFDPFFSTKGEKGSGLGLAMVYGVVQRHQGEISVKSAPGKGTTFTIRLPAGDVDAGQVGENGHRTGRVRPLRLLVVDDEPSVRQVIEEFLKEQGHQVDCASDATEALIRLRASPYDVIFTDRAMPGMSGDRLAEIAKSFAPHTPVVLVTGFGSMMEAAGEAPPGVDLVVGKPITAEVLEEVLVRVTADPSGAPRDRARDIHISH